MVKQSKFKPTPEQLEIIKEFANKISLTEIAKKMMEIDNSYRIKPDNVVRQMAKLGIPNTHYVRTHVAPTDEQLKYLKENINEPLKKLCLDLKITEYQLNMWIKAYNLLENSKVGTSEKTHGRPRKDRHHVQSGYFNVNQYSCWVTGEYFRHR